MKEENTLFATGIADILDKLDAIIENQSTILSNELEIHREILNVKQERINNG